MRVHITAKSSNKKTGPIPVTTTERASCPKTCPFYEKGCYAKSGPLALHWRKVSEGERGTDWDGLCNFISALPQGQLWRHNQAGDLVANNQGLIDSDKLMQLVFANNGKRGYTYTHHILNHDNIQQLQLANALGFTINASCESLAGADVAMDHGLPAVAVVSASDPVPECTPAGRKAILCPAQQRDVSCADCGLCAKSDRSCVVMFKAHGNAKNYVSALVS